MIGTFTTNGVVDEETQKNDLDIVREVLKVTKEVPIERAYDFSFAKKADSELTQAGWKPVGETFTGASSEISRWRTGRSRWTSEQRARFRDWRIRQVAGLNGSIPMKRSTERILTTHVGSLTRPAEVIDAMRAQGKQRALRPGKLCRESAQGCIGGRAQAGRSRHRRRQRRRVRQVGLRGLYQ